jgi:hypothetical protein
LPFPRLTREQRREMFPAAAEGKFADCVRPYEEMLEALRLDASMSDSLKWHTVYAYFGRFYRHARSVHRECLGMVILNSALAGWAWPLLGFVLGVSVGMVLVYTGLWGVVAK